MPRRYRPPVRRRKTKKPSVPNVPAQPSERQDIEALTVAPRTAVSTAAPVSRGEVKHVTRDYSYVRMEIRRMAIAGGIIISSLILTAVFLR